ncbi:hypothetical protein ACQJBY_054405 [Aegilops geniculata]
MASPPPSPPSGSRRRPAATFSPAGSHLLPRPHLLPGVAPPPPSSRRPPPPPHTFLPAPPRPAPSSRRRPSPHLLPGAAPPHTFFPAPPLPPPSSRRRPTFRRRAAPTSRPRTACTHPKRRRPILRLAKRHRPAHRRGPPPPLPPWPFDAITPGRSTPPPHAVHRRSTLDPPNYLSQCASADRLPPLERRCGPSPISLPWHSAVDCARPHLPLVPRGGIQGRARPFTAATPSVRSALPTKAVQRGVVQKQRKFFPSGCEAQECSSEC